MAVQLLWLFPLLVGRPGAPFPSVIERCVEQTCTGAAGTVDYRLYVPPGCEDASTPLLVWFHGRCESGQNNIDHLSWLELILGNGFPARDVACYILAVQATGGWLVDGEGPIDPLDRVEQATVDVLRQHTIDHDRIYLAGVSQGAVAVCRYAQSNPRRIAAMALMGMNQDVCVDASFRDIPVWAFQSTADGTGRLRALDVFVHGLSKYGSQARATVVSSSEHDCWTSAFQQHGLLEWLLTHRRGGRPHWPLLRRFAIAVLLGILTWLAATYSRRSARRNFPAIDGYATIANRISNSQDVAR